MKRFHLFEIEDQNWCPRTIRNGVTDFLHFIVDFVDFYKPISEKLRLAILDSEVDTVIDLCAGGAGPWKKLIQNLWDSEGAAPKIVLTDLHPNLSAFNYIKSQSNNKIDFIEIPINAQNIPVEIKAFRTLFSSFHHFSPDIAKSILQDAVNKNQNIAIFESTQRHLFVILYMLLVPFFVLVATVFIRPFSWGRIFWTYLIPIIPLVVMFDGIVSCLRTYTPEELTVMVGDLNRTDDYKWQIGLKKTLPFSIGITYLIGVRE